TVTFSSDEDHADLPDDYTFTAADAGTHTFSAAFNRFGTFFLAATDTANPSITGAQTGIEVVQNPHPHPPPQGAAAAFTATVVQLGNPPSPGGGGPAPHSGGPGQTVRPADYVTGAMASGHDDLPSFLDTPDGPWLDALDAVMAIFGSKREGRTG